MSKKTQDTIQDDPNAPRNDFLPFAATSTANVIDQAAYQTLEARTGGFVAGVAKSMQLNKVWRQSSIVAASIGQYINNRTGKDVIDDGDVLKLAALFEEAVKKTSGGGVPLGGIIAWSGAAAAIPAGYSLCNGQNGTPDLTGRFILGGAEKGVAGGSAKISIDQMPAHTHTGSTAVGGKHGHTGSATDAGTHTHSISDPQHEHALLNVDQSDKKQQNKGAYGLNTPTGTFTATTKNSSNISIQAVGNHSHTVSIVDGGDHSHTMSLDNTGGGKDYLPPYFQLCYIMRTSGE